LIALGVILFRREPSTAALVREPVRVGSGASAVPDVVDIPERPPRERSPLAWIVFGTSLLVMCVAAIAVQGGAVERIATVPALGLLVLGVGLLVASVFGRGRWLILPALLLVPPMLFASVIRLPIEGRYGDTAVYVRDISELPGAYHTVVGRVFVDLSKFDRRDDIRDLPLTLTAVAGSVTVIVPYDATYAATGYIGVGALSFGPDANETQIAATATVHVDPKYEGGPSFVFDLEAGVGNVTILREAPTRQQLRDLEKASKKEQHR
jgi:hypothetical protein